MDDLMKCLYDFVCEERMGNVMYDPEYRACICSMETQEKRVRDGLDQKHQQELNLLLQKVSAQNTIESEYLFQAALALARELNTLLRA